MCRVVIIFVLIMMGFNLVQAQSNLSPKFFAGNKRVQTTETLRFSVSVRDTNLFREVYKNKITILRFYKEAKTAIIKTTFEIVTNQFSKDENILFVDIPENAVAEAGTDHVNMSFNKINRLRSRYPTLRGSDQRILIKEQRFDTVNIDLLHRNFETALASSVFSQHATTIATIIAGSGSSSENAKGVAPSAWIGSSDFSNLLPDDDLIFNSNNAHLENHSYGVDIENYYGNEAAAYDDQVYRNPTLVHVFSAGNSGSSVVEQGTYSGLPFANLSGNFKQAKNIITVTAVDTSFQIDPRNSRGPAYDGRIKPELTAYGQDGTSDAAAIVSGVCALLQERYVKLYGRYPTASEIKSILIASADDVDRTGIDFTSGYGSVNADRAVSIIDQGLVETRTVSGGETVTIDVNVPSSTHQLRVAVSWIDPPAQQNSNTALVHDIDAVLLYKGERIEPWTLNPQPSMDALNTAAVRKPDHLNNVEYFTIDDPAADVYSLILTAPSTVASQDVSVAYWFEDTKIFQWNYPASSDKIKAVQKTTLLWDAQPKKIGTLFLSFDGGDWTTIADNLDLDNYFQWLPPDTFATAQLKMQIENTDFSSSPFSISPQPKISVAFDCDDQFALTWKPVFEVTDYDVYTFRHDSLEFLKTVEDTLVVMQKTSDHYFAVAPRQNKFSGLRSETIDYSNQGAFCYINLFDAQRYQKDQVTLQLNLSTTLNVDHILIYKTIGNTTSQLILATPEKNKLMMTWQDDDLRYYGIVVYQAVVVLASGMELKSEVREVYVEKKGAAIIFPNPVDASLTVLSEGAGFTVRIINLTGETMVTQDLLSTLDSIDMQILPSGIYVLQLLRKGELIDTERFLKI